MNNKKKTTKIKSGNKAAGLKSTLVTGNELYLTSFGRGNAAVLEQKIDTDSVESDGRYTVTPTNTFQILWTFVPDPTEILLQDRENRACEPETSMHDSIKSNRV